MLIGWNNCNEYEEMGNQNISQTILACTRYNTHLSHNKVFDAADASAGIFRCAIQLLCIRSNFQRWFPDEKNVTLFQQTV